MAEYRVLTEDVRAFQVSVESSPPVVVVSFYGGPDNACGSIRYGYYTTTEVDEAQQIANAWISCGTPLRILEDSEGVSTIRPMSA